MVGNSCMRSFTVRILIASFDPKEIMSRLRVIFGLWKMKQ